MLDNLKLNDNLNSNDNYNCHENKTNNDDSKYLGNTYLSLYLY